jgi:hypothetical protein
MRRGGAADTYSARHIEIISEYVIHRGIERAGRRNLRTSG